MASQRASGNPLPLRDAAARGTAPVSQEQGSRHLGGSGADEQDGKGRTGPSAGAWGGTGVDGTNTSIFHQALAARGPSRAQASNAPCFLPAEPSGPAGMDLPSLSGHQTLPSHRLTASALAASLLRQMQDQPAMQPQPQLQSQSRSPLESLSQSQPQRPPQPWSQSHAKPAGDVPSALAQLFQERLSQQGQMSQQGHGHLGQQRYLQQETLLGQTTAPASQTISPSMRHSTAAFSAPLLPCAEGAPAGGGNLASPAAAAALSDLLTANPSLRALLSAFGYGDPGGSQHGASEEVEHVCGPGSSGRGNFDGPSAQGLEGTVSQGGETVPGVMALMEFFELPSLPEMLQAPQRPDLAALGMRLPLRPQDKPLGAAAPRNLPPPGGLFKDTLESAVLGILDPALEAHAGEGRFSPAPREGRALGKEVQGGLAASRLCRTGRQAMRSVQQGARSLLGGSGSEAGAQGMRAGQGAFQAPEEEEDEQPIGRGPVRELEPAAAGALGGGAAPGMGSGEADARGRGVDCLGETESTLLRAAPLASPSMQECRAGLGAGQMEELEGSGADSQSTPGEGKLSTKGAVEKRRRERISTAFAELRAEMDIHGDMATVLLEAKRLVKKQKALIQNLQKQLYIQHVLKSSHDMFR